MDSLRDGAEFICRRLHNAGHRALLAGGCVRDLILNVPPRDYDIATDALPGQIEALFDRTIAVGAQFGVIVVLLDGAQYEVATFRKDGPYLDGRHPSTVTFLDEREDARRRDFTINAMFFDVAENRVLDYVSGQDDLKAGIIRCVGEPRQRFQEDHLRLVRAIRFAARLGFVIEPDTLAAVREMAYLITRTSPERVRDELVRMLTEGGAKRSFELMNGTGLLAQVLPEVDRMRGVQQPPEFHPEGDVFVHTLLMLDLMESPSPTLALGALLHDVGKPVTMTMSDRIRFNNHDKVGEDMARAICRRLHMSNETTERVVWLVGQHMRLIHAQDMRESKLKRFVREDGFPELLELGRLDCLASHGDLTTINWLKNYVETVPPETIRPAPLLTGNDLIAMGYRPGPLFSEILTAVEDAQLEGEIMDQAQARDYVAERWPR